MIVQQFQSLFKVAKITLGDGGSSSDPVSKVKSDPNVNLMIPKSAAELKSAFGKVFG